AEGVDPRRRGPVPRDAVREAHRAGSDGRRSSRGTGVDLGRASRDLRTQRADLDHRAAPGLSLVACPRARQWVSAGVQSMAGSVEKKMGGFPAMRLLRG